MNIHTVRAELFHADGLKDVKKLMVTYCNFYKTAYKCSPH